MKKIAKLPEDVDLKELEPIVKKINEILDFINPCSCHCHHYEGFPWQECSKMCDRECIHCENVTKL